jgi:hypothetical protein
MQSQKATDSAVVRCIGRNTRLAKNATTPGSSQILPTTAYVAPLTPYLGTKREIRDPGLDNPPRTEWPQRRRSTELRDAIACVTTSASCVISTGLDFRGTGTY